MASAGKASFTPISPRLHAQLPQEPRAGELRGIFADGGVTSVITLANEYDSGEAAAVAILRSVPAAVIALLLLNPRACIAKSAASWGRVSRPSALESIASLMGSIS